MAPFFIDYFCPTEGPGWRRLGAWLLNRQGNSYYQIGDAERACNGLLWRYHSVRVVDSQGLVVYSV